MPPRKRQKPASTAPVVPAKPKSSNGPRPAQSSNGLLAVPVEILDLISMHFGPCIPIPSRVPDAALPEEYRDRTLSLRALSQTCHHLRLVFLTLLWETWNICISPPLGGAFYKVLGDQLQRTSLGLVSEPELLSLAKTVNVVLTRYSSAEVLPPFARCLTQMPNLHTLQITHAHRAMTTHLKDNFAGMSLPSIRKIVLPSWAHEVLRCCPEVRHVVCSDGQKDESKLVSAIAKCCKKVEIIEWFWLQDNSVKRLVKAAPNITQVLFERDPGVDTISSLSAIKNLDTIEIQCTHLATRATSAFAAYIKTELEESLQKSIEAAKRLLRKQPTTSPHLRIRHIPVAWLEKVPSENWEIVEDIPV